VDLNDLKNLAEAFQALAVGTAVLTGGVWALYRFRMLNELGRANAELEQLRTTLERRSTLNVVLETGSVWPQPDGSRWVQVTARIHNVGTRSEVVLWERAGIRRAAVTGMTPERPQLGDIHITRYIAMPAIGSSCLEADEQAAFPFLVSVPRPGIYRFDFFAVRAGEEADAEAALHKRAGAVISEISIGTGLFCRIE
jgi:hypothetical protein